MYREFSLGSVVLFLIILFGACASSAQLCVIIFKKDSPRWEDKNALIIRYEDKLYKLTEVEKDYKVLK